MVGKFIQVIATGEDGSTANAATIVAVAKAEEADFAVSAAQTHAKVVEVTYTEGTPSADSTYKVTKGSQTLTVSSSVTKDNVVSLTMSENLTDGDFKVEVTTTAGKKAEASFTGQKPVLTEVKFTNNNLSVSANTTNGMKKGYAHIDSTDQFGDHMNLTSPSFTVSKGDASFKTDTGILTLDATSTTDGTYKLGEMVVVSVMYDNNTKVVPATLTVTTAAMAKTITFGDLTSDDTKTYPTDKITQSDLARGVYWFPVTEATDDSGITLDAERLNDMIEAGTVFVTPKEQAGTIIYADQFSEKTVDGKKVMALVVKGGDQLKGLNAGVEMSLSVFSVGGAQATLPVKIERDAVISNLEIDIPELYMGKTSEIKLSATDTDGKAVDLYKVTNNKSLAATAATAITAGTSTLTPVTSGEMRFFDTAQGTAAVGTKINLSTGSVTCTWELVRNATDHSVSLKVTPTGGADEGYLNMTGTTAAFTAITKANIKINKARTIDGVVGFNTNVIKTKVLNTNTASQNLADNIVLSQSDGSELAVIVSGTRQAYFVMDAAGALASAASVGASVTVDGITFDAPATTRYLYTIEEVGVTPSAGVYTGNGFVLTNTAMTGTAGTPVTGTCGIKVRNVETGKSDNIKISLYKVSKVASAAATADTRVELLGTKTVAFSVENEDTAQYEVSLSKTDNVLYAGKYSGNDSIPVSIVTQNGSAVPSSKIVSVKVVNKNSDEATFEYKNGAVYTTNPSTKAAGQKMTATINATISSNGDTIEVSKDFTYQTDQPVVTYTGLYSNAAMTNAVAGNKVKFADTTAKIGGGNQGVWIKYQDQYYTDASLDGITVNATLVNKSGSAASLTGAQYSEGVVTLIGSSALAAAAGEFQVVVNGGTNLTLYCDTNSQTITPLTKASTSKTATTEAELNAALAAASSGDIVKVTAPITMTDAINATTGVPAGVTLQIESTGTLTTDGDSNVFNGPVVNKGTLNLAGTTNFAAGGSNDGTVNLITNSKTYDLASVAGQTFTNIGTIDMKFTTASNPSLQVTGTLINNGTVTNSGNVGIIGGTGTWVNNAGASADATTINMTNANSFDNYGRMTATTISGYVKVLDSSAEQIAVTTYDANTIVPAGVTATVQAGATDKAVITATGNSDVTVAVTDIDNMTIVGGQGTVVDESSSTLSTSDGKAKIGIAVSGADSENRLREWYGALTGKTLAAGTNNANGDCFIIMTNAVAGKHYYAVTTNGSTSELLANTNNGVVSGPLDMTSTTSPVVVGGWWNASNGNNVTYTSVQLYVSDTALTAEDISAAGYTLEGSKGYTKAESTITNPNSTKLTYLGTMESTNGSSAGGWTPAP